jgi:hypothetical protein
MLTTEFIEMVALMYAIYISNIVFLLCIIVIINSFGNKTGLHNIIEMSNKGVFDVQYQANLFQWLQSYILHVHLFIVCYYNNEKPYLDSTKQSIVLNNGTCICHCIYCSFSLFRYIWLFLRFWYLILELFL